MGRRCKETKLLAKWSKKEGCLEFYYPRSCDGHLLHGIFSCKRIAINWKGIAKHNFLEQIIFDPSFTDELEKRGYDLKTLRFEIALKETNNDT